MIKFVYQWYVLIIIKFSAVWFKSEIDSESQKK